MSNDNDTVNVLGVRADGSSEVIGTAPMPPKMKARELVREAFGHWTDEDGSEADMAMYCCEQLIEYLGKTYFSITLSKPAAAPAAAQDAIAAAVAAEREACAQVCEATMDKTEQDKADQRAREAQERGDQQDQLARLKHWMTVSTFNAGLRNAAKAIRERGAAGATGERT